MKRKFLIFAIMIFIIAIGAVSAQDINNDTVVSYENQNIGELSTVDVNEKTADILQNDSNSEISVLGEDKVVESIVANDVVDEFSFSATFFDSDGNPLINQEVGFYVENEDDSYSDMFYRITDSDGFAAIDCVLPMSNYSVYVSNYFTGEYNYYWWNITKNDDSKFVEIVAYLSGVNLIVSAVDGNGNKVTKGTFMFTGEDGRSNYRELSGDSSITLNLYYFGGDYPQNISIEFYSDYYFSANSTVYVDKLNDTIVACDVVDEFSFNATFFDGFGNPLDYNENVLFYIWDEVHSRSYNLRPTTDSEGVAVISPALPVGNYTVNVMNYVTMQTKHYWWNLSKVDDSKSVEIVAYQSGVNLIVGAVDKEGNNITIGTFILNSENGQQRYYSLSGKSFISCPLYDFDSNDYPQNINIRLDSDDYYPTNSTVYVDKLINTIVACDVVDEFSFNATFFDGFGNPLKNETVSVHVSNDKNTYSRSLNPITDSNGVAIVNIPLFVDNYTVWLYNPITSQYVYYDWNITKEYESRFASINVTRDKYRFKINVFDNEGNRIDDGLIEVYIEEDYNTINVEVNNGTAIFDYICDSWHTEGEKHLVFTFISEYYYPVNTTSNFVFINTISAGYTVGNKFNATFTDIYGSPLKNHDVMFIIYEKNKLVDNITVKTDENGFVSIERDKGDYTVIIKNLATYQEKNVGWINKEQLELTPVAFYDEDSQTYITNNKTLIFKVSPDATGEITISGVEEYSWYRKLPTSEFNITLPRLGSQSLYIAYGGDENYASLYKLIFVTVKELLTPNMTISENLTGDYGEKVNFTVNLEYDSKAISNASVIIIVGNNTYNMTTDENGDITLPLELDAGKYDVSVSYAGSKDYNPVNKATTLTINKIDPAIAVNKTTIDYGEKLIVNVNDDAEGKITVEINGKKYEAAINNSKAEIDLNNLAKGSYNAILIYSGDDNYNNYTINSNITISPVEISDFNVTANPVTAGEAAEIEIQLSEDATGNVTAVVNGKTYSAPVKDGKATITIPDLAAGNYTVPVTYSGDDKYDSISKDVNVTVEEDKSIIIKAPDVTKYVGGPERFVVTVTDYQGNALTNKSVTIGINGASYARTTDANGTASIALGLNSGVYNATVTVDNKTINSVVTILTTVNGTDIVKIFRNATQYYATFRDGEGNYLKDGETVRFNINGVMYDRKVSGKEGLARLNINLEAGEYVITAMNLVTGDRTANNITVLSRITENADLTKYYRNASQYTVKILGEDGRAVGAGESVTFNINGVFYTRQTDANGIVKLNINLQPGDYVITAEYSGCMVANNIKVLPILNATDINMKYRDGTQFKATLVDGQGKPYSGQSITFNINGVFYNRETDSLGQAKLNINLMPGEYIITSSYNGSSIANKITIKG